MAEELKKKALEIVVDDGSERISVKNKTGEEIGEFYFRPTDIGIIQRYNEAVAKFDEIVAPLENISITAEGTAQENDKIAEKALAEAERRLFEVCDFIFDGNMSEAFFGKMHPFSPINGSFYCENALNQIGAFISAQFEQETKKINRRMSKYIASKGGHKK